MSTKAYKQAIEILMSRDVDIDYRSLVVKLAQHSPTLFNQLYAEMTEKDTDRPLMDVDEQHVCLVILNHMRYHGAKVESIKAIRTQWGFGLKEAKDIVDHLSIYLANNGYNVSPYSDPSPLSLSQREVLNKLVWVEKNF